MNKRVMSESGASDVMKSTKLAMFSYVCSAVRSLMSVVPKGMMKCKMLSGFLSLPSNQPQSKT